MSGISLITTKKVEMKTPEYHLLTATSTEGENFVFLKLENPTRTVTFSQSELTSILKVFRSAITKPNQSEPKAEEPKKDQTSSQKTDKKSTP